MKASERLFARSLPPDKRNRGDAWAASSAPLRRGRGFECCASSDRRMSWSVVAKIRDLIFGRKSCRSRREISCPRATPYGGNKPLCGSRTIESACSIPAKRRRPPRWCAGRSPPSAASTCSRRPDSRTTSRSAPVLLTRARVCPAGESRRACAAQTGRAVVVAPDPVGRVSVGDAGRLVAGTTTESRRAIAPSGSMKPPSGLPRGEPDESSEKRQP